MTEKELTEKQMKAVLRAKMTIEKLGEVDVAWKPLLADAMLNLFASLETISAEDVTRVLEAGLQQPTIRVLGTDMRLETGHIALRAAMRHLADSVAKREQKKE